MPVSGVVTEAGAISGKWGIPSITLKWFCDDSGLSPTNKTEKIIKTK